MKTLFYFLAIMMLLTGIQCASLRSDAIKLNSKWDDTFDQPVKSVYIKIKTGVPNIDEKMYDTLIRGFKKSLQQKSIVVREDFTGDAPDANLSGMNASFKPDVWLVLGRPFRDEWKVVESGVISSNRDRQRLVIQLVDPATERDIWVGEPSFFRKHAGFVGDKVVQQLEQIGLLAPAKQE